jgi:phosphate transport system permease protein
MEPPSPRARRGERAVSADTQGAIPVGSNLLNRVRLLRWLERAFRAGTLAIALGLVALVALLAVTLVQGSWLSLVQFGPGFLMRTAWNAQGGSSGDYAAGPAIVGTLLTSAIALLIAVPVALGVAIFLSEVAPPWLRRPLAYAIDLSAAVPSVVYGFWAFIVLVPLMQSTVEPGLVTVTGGVFPFSPIISGPSLLTASLVLAVMVIPTIAAVSRESLRAVPRIHRESALSLGATRWEATRMSVLRQARGGIAAGAILGLGRALGETIAVTMVIGNLYILPGTLFSQGSTLATQIVNNFNSGAGLNPALNQSAVVELALILFGITVAVNAGARGLLWRIGDRDSDASTSRGTGSRSRWFSWGPRHTAQPRAPPGRPVVGRSPQSTTSLGLTLGPSRARSQLHIGRRRAVQWGVVAVTAACVVAALAPFASVIYTAVDLGGSAVVTPSFYTSLAPQGCNPAPNVTCQLGGIGNEIQGTLIMLALGAAIAIPVGLLVGIFLAEYGRNRFARSVSFLADVMTGIPTIVLAVFVYTIFVVVDPNAALSALSGGVALGVLMIPISTRAVEEALRAVPVSVRESALALGFPRHRVALRVALGSAKGGIVTGFLLAASRAAGDTATLLFTAVGSVFWFKGLNTETAAITPFIFNNYASGYLNLRTDAWGAALVLLGIMLIISLGARLAVDRGEAAMEGS